jgi:uncharacterized protein YjbI with pentapeptide repeats
MTTGRLKACGCLLLAALALPAAGCGGGEQGPASTSGSDTTPRRGFDAVVRGCRIEPDTQCPAADLIGVNLSYADLNHANLSDADLWRAVLNHANLSHADLRAARLADARLRHANLSGADLENADVRDARLVSADFSNANLVNADFRNALYNDLVSRDWAATNFSNADLRRANLKTSETIRGEWQPNFTGAKFEDTVCPNGTVVTSPQSC